MDNLDINNWCKDRIILNLNSFHVDFNRFLIKVNFVLWFVHVAYILDILKTEITSIFETKVLVSFILNKAFSLSKDSKID